MREVGSEANRPGFLDVGPACPEEDREELGAILGFSLDTAVQVKPGRVGTSRQPGSRISEKEACFHPGAVMTS